MRILRLSNSTDLVGGVGAGEWSAQVVEGRLAEALGAPVETVVKSIWPAPELLAIIERWIDQHQPEVVLLRPNNFWWEHESAPLKLERKFGPLGKRLAGAGVRASEIRWLARTRAFRAARRMALWTIGGVPYFQPGQVLVYMEACIRRILLHEEIVLAVFGSPMTSAVDVPAAVRRRAMERRQQVYGGLGRLCEELHVACFAPPGDYPPANDSAFRDDDLLHLSAAGHRWQGSLEADLLLEALQRAGRIAQPIAQSVPRP